MTTNNTVESLNLNRMKIYVNNVRELYLIAEHLTACIEKKMRRGVEVQEERLAKSSAMYDLTRRVAKAVQEYDNDTPSREDKRAFRAWCADMIILYAEDNVRYSD